MPRFTAIATALFASLALAAPALSEPAMWTLVDEDTTIHILGTVHVLPEDLEWRSDRITAAFNDADTVCFEVDAQGRALETLGLTFENGTMKNGDRLVNHITDEQEADLRELAAEFGIPFTSLNVMKPWFAYLTIGEYVTDRMKLGDGVEFTLYPEIEASGKTLCEMETLDEQIGSLWRMSLEDQLDVLLYEAEDTEDLTIKEQVALGEEELNTLIKEWVTGDVAALSDIINEEASINAPFHNALLTSRNERWIPRIEAMLERDGGNIFIAVGAAHLAGDDSVIKMLRDKGYTVKGP